MRWATRPRCHVDRAACGWLIRRFIDPDAEFIFVEDVDDVPADAMPFDMRGVELGHVDGACSFERFLVVHELHDEALEAIARIVHEADLADGRFPAPEAPGLDLVVSALAVGRTDSELLAECVRVFEGMYAVLGGSELRGPSYQHAER